MPYGLLFNICCYKQKCAFKCRKLYKTSYHTKYFHLCPGASSLYMDIESKGVDMDMAERSARLHDVLFFIEEHIQRDGYKPEKDYIMVAKNLAKNIMKMAKMMGLEKEHSYIQGHVDIITKTVEGKKLEEKIIELTEKNVPTDKAKWAASKAAAKKKFDVYPSAYANAWAAKNYKGKGGGWRTTKENVEENTVNEVDYSKMKPSQVSKAISRMKKLLMKKWRKKGGYENFGQRELDVMKDKLDYNPYGTPDERKIAKMLDGLNNWAMNYDGSIRESVNEAYVVLYSPKKVLKNTSSLLSLMGPIKSNLAIGHIMVLVEYYLPFSSRFVYL